MGVHGAQGRWACMGPRAGGRAWGGLAWGPGQVGVHGAQGKWACMGPRAGGLAHKPCVSCTGNVCLASCLRIGIWHKHSACMLHTFKVHAHDMQPCRACTLCIHPWLPLRALAPTLCKPPLSLLLATATAHPSSHADTGWLVSVPTLCTSRRTRSLSFLLLPCLARPTPTHPSYHTRTCTKAATEHNPSLHDSSQAPSWPGPALALPS